MKNRSLPLFFLFSLLLAFSACKNEASTLVNAPDTKVEFVLQGQAWVENISSEITSTVDWTGATVSTDKSRLVVPLKWEADLEKGGKASRRLILFRNSKGNIIDGKVVEILPIPTYYVKYHDRVQKHLFVGTLGIYDIRMNFKYGIYYEKGKAKYQATIEKYRERPVHFNQVVINCHWQQTSYVDSDGVFTVVNTQTCDVYNDGDPALQEEIDWIDQSDQVGAGSGSSANEGPDGALYDVDCTSFYFVNTSSNWQEAGVTKVRLAWRYTTVPDNRMHVVTIEIPKVVSGLPIKYGTGLELSPGEAAELTAENFDKAKIDTYQNFHTIQSQINQQAVINYFIGRANYYMTIIGGRAGTTGSGSTKIVFRDEERSMSPGGCK